MNWKPSLLFVPLLILVMVFAVAGCGTSSDHETSPADETDDDMAPPLGDDDASGDDDTAGDDDASDDDDADDDAADDDTTDDDDDDTPPPPGWPRAEINSPEDGASYASFTITINADIFEVSSADDITVMVDATNITSTLNVTATKVTGEVTLPIGGWHELSIIMVNELGTTTARARFFIEQPYITVLTPQAGSIVSVTPVPVRAEFGYVTAASIVVKLDGAPITGSLEIFSGEITGDLTGLDEGDHELIFTGEPSGGGDTIEVSVPFVLEFLPPHFDVSVSATTVSAGDTVDVNYTFYDENGQDITSSVSVDISTDPAGGAVIGDDQITFTEPGIFQVIVGTLYDSEYYEGTAIVYVLAASAWDIVLTLSDYEIDAGGATMATTVVTDEDGNVIDYADIVYRFMPPLGVTMAGPMITITRAGTTQVTASVAGTLVSDSKIVTVLSGEPAELTISCEPPTVATGETATCYVAVLDEYGNPVPDAPYVYTVFPSNGVTIIGDEFTFAQAGYFVVTAEWSVDPDIHDQAIVQVTESTTPGIVITSPNRALYTDQDTVVVEGYITDVNFLDPSLVVYMNGNAIYFDWQTGDFGPENFTLANGLNIIELEVVINEGSGPPLEQHARASTSVLYAGYEWPNGSAITDAVGLRLTEGGFDDIEDVIESYITDIDFEEIIMAQNPIFDERVEVWGLTIASARANVTGVDYDPPTVNFNVEPSALATEARMRNVVLDFSVRGSILGIGYSVSGDVSVSSVDLDTFTWLYLDPETGIISVDMENFDVSLAGFNISIDGFPDELIDLFEDTVRDAVEDAASMALEAMIPPLLQAILDNLELAFNIPVGGVDFTFAARPAELVLDADGMTTWMDADVLASSYDPSVRPLNGSIRTPGSRPDLGGTTIPYIGQGYGIGVGLADDVINKLLYEFYRSGQLHADLDDAFDACSLLFYLLLPQICDEFGGSAKDPVMVDVKVRPQLPPVMIFSSGKAGVVATEIQLGDTFIYLYADGPSGSEPVLTLAISAKVPTDISHDWDTNSLEIGFGTVEATGDTIDNPYDMPEALFEDIAPYLIELVFPLLEQLLGGITLPTFEVGADVYKMQVSHLLIIGSGNDYLGIYGSIEPDLD